MKFSTTIIIFALSFLIIEMSGADSAGMTAFREGNFGAAVRLLKNEKSEKITGSKEYFELALAYIESLLRTSSVENAKLEMAKIKSEIPAELKVYFNFLEAQQLYIENDLKNCGKILANLQKENISDNKLKYEIAVLLADVYLKDNRPAEAVKILNTALKNPEIVAVGEMPLKLLELRALASAGQLNPIPAKLNDLKAKFPAQQGRLQHFELLLHAINQDLPAYNELFKKIFPDEVPLRAFIGDQVLYQGALLAEQQAHKEKNIKEIALHLKNQTFFAPNDDIRAESCKNLIQLYLDSKQKQAALNAIKFMLQTIPELPDRMQWEIIMADLMYELNSDDRGLQTYLNIKNSKTASPELRAKAAMNAADIYRQQNNKSEMLKLYAFLADFPNAPAINDAGILLTGKYYFSNKEFRMGESILNRVAPGSAKYPEALLYLIQCKINNGEIKEAAADISKLANLKDIEDDSLPELSLAAAYFNAVIAELQKQNTKAAELFEKIARTGSKRTGGIPLVINSWLKAAELHFMRQSYQSAGLLFLTFAEQYPEHPSAATAFYKSVYSYFLAERFEEMQNSIDKLLKKFPENKLTVNALFHKTDVLRETDRMQEALQVLDLISQINKKLKDKNTEAQVYYDRALILYHLQQADKALQNLDELKKFPELPQSAEGMFLAGTIAADRGDLMKSAENYLQAAVMRPAETIFSAISFGRAADSLFIIGSKTKNEKILKRSADIYASLIKNKKINSDFKLQCLYKLGRTLENLNDFQGAIDAYTEALYLPGNDGIKNAVIPIWINKSALNAINIYMRLGGSSALNDSLYIIRRLKKLNTMTQTELDSLEYNVRERYINNSQ